ncbi:methyltransferase domain-containing protein [Paenibacillus sp. WQ 127069]|uniref:Methyltransferase domain-containing protein n=1 Tax=Paenibacillus baimaensis TaxID=2982185 RepID=A0ABT2USQ8_9BACL|nr:methyltransferase domain-containing protein [Paenibacillus sp. WQ 127069]MCU6797672.1 methyltransferase domain-containing protein [Paenibacillus sp. WQ 127069]
MADKSNYLTTGQMAKRTGLTVRTLRYYDQIGLLSPSPNVDPSKRMYSKQDMIRLQKIQTLKYIGLSLQEITKLLNDSSLLEQDLRSSLALQKEIMLQKTAHMKYVVRAISEAMDLLDEQKADVDWGGLADLIQIVHTEKDWAEQYLTAYRLQARIELYDKFSANTIGWHHWFFEHLRNQPDLKILELGCGNGTLWARNINRIPESWNITLTDLSAGMLDEARKHIDESDNRFKYLIADAQSIPFHNEQFDIVIANHMLYHVSDIPKALSEIYRVMKSDAVLYASTMSKSHLREIEHIANAFDPHIQVLDPVMERFEFDNGNDMLEGLFSEIKLIRYEDEMIVDQIQPLLNYITSTPMNARSILTGVKLEKFKSFLQVILDRDGSIHISKDTGFFQVKKKA